VNNFISCRPCPVLSVTFVYCGETVGWMKMKLGMQVGLGPGHIVLDDPAHAPLQGAQPPFSAYICCGQMAGWIKMPLGREVGLSPSDIVLDGDPTPPKKGSGAAKLRSMSILAKRLDLDVSRCHLVRK